MYERIIVVTKKTPLEEMLVRQHSRRAVAFTLQSRGVSVDEFDVVHEAYHRSLSIVIASLPKDTPHAILPREEISAFLFRETDLIIVVGPDGLCANVGKYVQGQPVIAVNPDPQRIEGVLMRFAPTDVGELTLRLKKVNADVQRVTLAHVRTNDGQTLYAVNDVLIGRRDQISARYTIKHHGREERQSSSGVLVSTGIGSSGWMTSVSRTASALTGNATRERIPFSWDERHLLFVVREAFPSRYTGTGVISGTLSDGEHLTVVSEMPEGGAIFADGVLEDAIEFNAGTIATVTVADKTMNLVQPFTHKGPAIINLSQALTSPR